MNNKNYSLKINFLMNIVLTMSSFIFPLITFPYISRVLLPSGVGRVSFATSIITYFSQFAQLGIPTYGIRECAHVRDDRQKLTQMVHELLIINIITCVVSYVLLIFAVIYVEKLYIDRVLIFIVSISIFLTAIGMEWLYKGLEQYAYITTRSIVFKLIAVIAMFMLVHSSSDYLIYGGISIFASSASNILNFLNAHKFISFRPLRNYNFKRHIKPILIFFATTCIATIYTNLDTVMLGFFKTDIDVGYYNAAVKIKTILLSIVTSLGAVILPRASYYVENNMRQEFNIVIGKSINLVCVFGAPLTIYFILFAKEGILFLSGEQFLNSVIPMQVLMPAVFIVGISNIIGIQMFIPLGKEKKLLLAQTTGVIIDVVINTIMIPRFASTGAAIGTIFAELTVLITLIILSRNDFKDIQLNIRYKAIILSLIMSIAVTFFIKRVCLTPFISLLISGIGFMVIYFISLLLLRESLVTDVYKQLIDCVHRRNN